MKYKVVNSTPYTRWRNGVKLPQGVEKELELEKDEAKELSNSNKFSIEKVEEKKEEKVEEDDEEFDCDECGEAFKTEKGLKLHKTKSH